VPEAKADRLRGQLGTPTIMCLVLAMLAPITGVAGPLALGFALGNGAGLPGAFLIATAVMLCFGAGYAAMSSRVSETGAFYAYITKGLGRPAGGAGAFVALLSYNAGFCGMCGAIGYFSWALVHRLSGFDAPWWVYTAAALGIIAFLGRRHVDIGARVLVGLLVLQIALLLAFVVATVAHHGFAAFSWRASFSPAAISSGGWNGFSIAMMFAFFLFGGIEMAAVYAEEARDPQKAIGRATYASVLAIGGIYLVASWCVIVSVGAGRVQQRALESPGELAFDVFGQLMGPTVQVLAAVLVIAGLLASMVGIHLGISRYVVALARDRLLPRGLASLHPRHKVPQRASAAAIAVAAAITAAFGAVGGDPLRTFFASLSGLIIIGTLATWVATSLAFIVYFRRTADPRWWQTFVLPVVALVSMSACLYLALTRYHLVTGVETAWINELPWVLVPAIVLGAGVMLYLRARHPDVYAGIWPEKPPLREEARCAAIGCNA